jgi:hypothetical protein
MLFLKILGLKVRVKHRIDNYINDNSDEIGVKLIEKCCADHYVMAAASVDDFMNHRRPKKGKIIIWSYNTLICLINIRFLLMAIINEPWILTLFADPLYIIRKGNLWSLNLALCGIMASITQTVYIFIEERSELRPIFQLYLSNRYHYGLRSQYYSKFCLKSNFMTKYILGPLLRLGVFGLTVFYIGLIIKAYFDSNFEFPIIKSILSTIVLLIWFKHSCALVLVSVVFFYITSLHLKYNFRQIKNSMKQNLKFCNSVIIDVIHKNNYISEITLEYNKVFRYLLAVNYSLMTPIMNILVYMTVSEVNSVLRIIYENQSIRKKLFFKNFIMSYPNSIIN